jgi:hypothetical protein
MGPFYEEWIVLFLSAVIITLLLTAPILMAVLIIRILRKGVSSDRQRFEEEVLEKLEEINAIQASMMKKLDEIIG